MLSELRRSWQLLLTFQRQMFTLKPASWLGTALFTFTEIDSSVLSALLTRKLKLKSVLAT